MIIGIDPGLKGAVAYIGLTLEIFDIPTFSLIRGGKMKNEIDLVALAALFAPQIKHAYMEQVGAMPGQGVSSMFAFGQTFGILKGMLAMRGIPFTLVPPATWKKALRVPAGKDGARARASQLLPSYGHYWPRAKDDGRAEAAMIALYGVREQSAKSETW